MGAGIRISAGKLVCALITGFLFAFSLVFGPAYIADQTPVLSHGGSYAKLLPLWVVTSVSVFFLWEGADRLGSRRGKPSPILTGKRSVLLWGLLMLCRLPFYLACFPGFFTYDAGTALIQVLYEDVAYSTQNPLLHTLLLGGVIKAVWELTGSYNAGVAVFCVGQMAFCTLVYTCIIRTLDRRVGSRGITVFAILYYALLPTITLLSFCTTKDTLSGHLMVLFLLWFEELFAPGDEGARMGKLQVSGFVLLEALMLLSRKNLPIAFAVFFVVQLFFRKKDLLRRTAVLLLGCLLAFGVNRALEWRLQPEEGSIAEAFSVPACQLARVYREYGESAFSEEEWELLDRYIYIVNPYYPFNADQIKSGFKETIDQRPGGFLKLWAKVGLRYPEEYLDAFLALTAEAWYPFTDIDGYCRTDYAGIKGGTDYFMCIIEEPASLHSLLPGLFDVIWHFSREMSLWKIPVLGFFLSVGGQLWCWIFAAGYAISRRRKELYPVFALIAGLIFTNFMGPIVLVRYYLILYLMLPVFVGTIGKQRE